METTIVDFVVPKGWHELSEPQLRFVYCLIAAEYDSAAIQTFCLLQWAKVDVIGRQESGKFLLRKDKNFFEVTTTQMAEVISELDWLASLPNMPIRPSKLHGRKALAADFLAVPFETYIVAENLYQGYLTTQSDSLLDELAEVLYPHNRYFIGRSLSLKPWEKIAVFYWVASLKDFFARKFPDFFSPAGENSDGNLLASSSSNSEVEDAMNAQIRALTKGDVTKEREILALDTWRALIELNAQAKEYKQLNAQLHAKR